MIEGNSEKIEELEQKITPVENGVFEIGDIKTTVNYNRYKLDSSFKLCNGQNLQKNDYPELYNIIKYHYGYPYTQSRSFTSEKENRYTMEFDYPVQIGNYLYVTLTSGSGARTNEIYRVKIKESIGSSLELVYTYTAGSSENILCAGTDGIYYYYISYTTSSPYSVYVTKFDGSSMSSYRIPWISGSSYIPSIKYAYQVGSFFVAVLMSTTSAYSVCISINNGVIRHKMFSDIFSTNYSMTNWVAFALENIVYITSSNAADDIYRYDIINNDYLEILKYTADTANLKSYAALVNDTSNWATFSDGSNEAIGIYKSNLSFLEMRKIYKENNTFRLDVLSLTKHGAINVTGKMFNIQKDSYGNYWIIYNNYSGAGTGVDYVVVYVDLNDGYCVIQHINTGYTFASSYTYDVVGPLDLLYFQRRYVNSTSSSDVDYYKGTFSIYIRNNYIFKMPTITDSNGIFDYYIKAK